MRIATFATLEGGFGIGVGCKAFQLLMRLRLVPTDVCIDCADNWARQRA